jgi:hypothetical protein
MAKTHELKIWPQWFDAVRLGTKTFEIRKDDRNYAVGDTLVLNEFRPGVGEYTGRKIERRINYILPAGEKAEQFGLQAGYAALGIVPV